MNIEESNGRFFIPSGKYRWEIQDKHGYSLDKSQLRDLKLNSILDGVNSDIHYVINIQSINRDRLDICCVLFQPYINKLKIYPLSNDDSIRVQFKANDINDCEKLVDLICEGNNMVVMPVFKTNQK